MPKPLSYKTCPKCKGRATKIVHLSNPPERAIECQQCGHEYPFPDTAQ